MPDESELAASHMIGHLLMVIIAIIAAIFILQSIHLPELDWEYPEPPVIFSITSIDSSPPYYESWIYLRNIVKKDFDNRELSAKIYRNGELLPCTIETLSITDFINTVHNGVEKLKGKGGCSGTWNYNQMLGMDLSNGLIHPGDTIRVDIIETETDTVISRDSTEA